tara:strand:+ start:4091 stop:4387 length:297 start_codon:yes stop_codon:yes gene_type:complete
MFERVDVFVPDDLTDSEAVRWYKSRVEPILRSARDNGRAPVMQRCMNAPLVMKKLNSAYDHALSIQRLNSSETKDKLAKYFGTEKGRKELEGFFGIGS